MGFLFSRGFSNLLIHFQCCNFRMNRLRKCFTTSMFIQTIKGALSCLRQLLITESPLKMMKNAFNFTLKALLDPRYLDHCLEFLVISKNGLIRKVRLFSKFKTSQPG